MDAILKAKHSHIFKALKINKDTLHFTLLFDLFFVLRLFCSSEFMINTKLTFLKKTTEAGIRSRFRCVYQIIIIPLFTISVVRSRILFILQRNQQISSNNEVRQAIKRSAVVPLYTSISVSP